MKWKYWKELDKTNNNNLQEEEQDQKQENEKITILECMKCGEQLRRGKIDTYHFTISCN